MLHWLARSPPQDFSDVTLADEESTLEFTDVTLAREDDCPGVHRHYLTRQKVRVTYLSHIDPEINYQNLPLFG